MTSFPPLHASYTSSVLASLPAAIWQKMQPSLVVMLAAAHFPEGAGLDEDQNKTANCLRPRPNNTKPQRLASESER